MKLIEVAGAVIVDARAEILCALRSQAMSMPGAWEFPGGKLECGEAPEACLAREIREELAVAVRVGERIVAHTHVYPHATVRLTTYFAAIARGTPVAHEHERLLWLPLERLDELAWAEADLPTIARLRQEPGLLARAVAALTP